MTKEKIKAEYLRGECPSIYAVEALQRECGLSSREAEAVVDGWEENPAIKYETGNRRYPREEDDENNGEAA